MDIINPLGKDILKVETEFCGRPLSLEINRLAFRSQAAVLAQYGQTTVLAAVNVGEINHALDYFPLSIEYEERFYAAGKISGSRYIKREGRPSEDAILTCRLIDRPIRPLFPKGYRNEVQAVATVLSLDPQMRPDALAMLAVSSALTLTGAPFLGPIAGTRLAHVDGKLIVAPSLDEQAESDLDIMIASNRTGVMMVEAAAHEVSEEVIDEALQLAHQSNQALLELQEALMKKVNVEAQVYELILPEESLKNTVQAYLENKLEPVVSGSYVQRQQASSDLGKEFTDYFRQQLGDEVFEANKNLYQDAFEAVVNAKIREKIIVSRERIDGRKLDQVRSLSSQVDILPRVHGSALFTRGATQALNIVTLAAASMAQLIDTMERDGEKHYFHHYNAPGYTVGEIKRLGGPGRREIGHSYLAERALQPVLPSQEEFPYTIRSVTEIMSQHGSTSMAATCASCLALMDAGVPLKAPVSGVAMGLILTPEGEPLILTDIADAEDFAGDMDFKVAGTQKGVTSLQMDMKVAGLSPKILAQALAASKAGRAKILEHMLSVLARPREDLKTSAPRFEKLKIDVNKIRSVIGKGGETIHALVADTGAQIDVKDDGTILIFSSDMAACKEAVKQIRELTEDPQPGRIYCDRPVVKVMDFGVFVNLTPGQDGMVHVSEISDTHVRHPSDVLKEGDKVDVKLIAIDEQGRFSLSIKKAVDADTKKQPEHHEVR